MPFSARVGVLEGLEAWATGADAFAGCLIGGRGGAGKTRLGIELCIRAGTAGWLSGLLSRRADLPGLEVLAQTPTPRLVVIDYAETRAEQLEVVLPLLKAHAMAESPVRVLLLVRAGPRQSNDWTEALRHHTDGLDDVLDDVEIRVLEDDPLKLDEVRHLFTAASAAFAARTASTPTRAFDPPDELSGAVFTNPLPVVIAAYLAVHAERLPTTRAALLEELVAHEDRYWEATARDLGTDRELRMRVVALATLAGAFSEAEAVRLLRLVPDLRDATAERCGRLARWAHRLYPGPRWWNPLEPDLVGEHLVATSYQDNAEVLSGVLDQRDQEGVFQPLDLYARAASDPEHSRLAAALTPVLTKQLGTLCSLAVSQAANQTDLDLLLGATSVAAALNQVVAVIQVDPSVLRGALARLPRRNDLTLVPLALTLAAQLLAYLRPQAKAFPAAFDHLLAGTLNDLSIRLAQTGRIDEGLATIEEAVEVERRLAEAYPAVYESELAGSLNNLSNRLAEAGRRDEGLAAVEEAVEIQRRLAVVVPAYEAELATILNNLSNRLAQAGRRDESLAAIEEAVEIERRLAAADPADYESELAGSLHNLSNRLAVDGRRGEGLAAIEEAVEIQGRLAATNPAAYEADLAISMSSLSNRLAEVGRRDEGLAAIEDAVQVQRRLVLANPAAHERALARSLITLSTRLAGVGRRDEGLVVSEEAVEMYRRLTATNPVAHEANLALSLSNLSSDLVAVGRPDEALAAIEESVRLRRGLAEADAAAYRPDLAASLNNLSNLLAATGRSVDGLAASEEAVELYRSLAAAGPATLGHDLAASLSNLAARLAEAGRGDGGAAASRESVMLHRSFVAACPAAFEPDLAASLNTVSVVTRGSLEGLAASEEAVMLYRRLAAACPAAYEPDLARSLNNLALRLAEVGQSEDGIQAIDETVKLWRRLAATTPAAFAPDLAMALRNQSILLRKAGRLDEMPPREEASHVPRSDTDHPVS